MIPENFPETEKHQSTDSTDHTNVKQDKDMEIHNVMKLQKTKDNEKSLKGKLKKWGRALTF